MRVIPIGVNSAFATGDYVEVEGKFLYDPKWQSNFLIEFENATFGSQDKIFRTKQTLRFLLDIGGDARHALKRFSLSVNDLDIIYLSHPHNDHIGGVECLALSTFFNPYYNTDKLNGLRDSQMGVLTHLSRDKIIYPHWKPMVIGESEVLADTWEACRPGLNTLQAVRHVKLDTYFDSLSMDEQDFYIEEKLPDNTFKRWNFYTVESTHVVSGSKHMPSFGLFFESVNKKIYFPTDTMLMMPPAMRDFYERADVIYQDTEVGIPSGVHSHIDDIEKNCAPEIKKKLHLYHYSKEPEIDESQYASILRVGDIHNY